MRIAGARGDEKRGRPSTDAERGLWAAFDEEGGVRKGDSRAQKGGGRKRRATVFPAPFGRDAGPRSGRGRLGRMHRAHSLFHLTVWKTPVKPAPFKYLRKDRSSATHGLTQSSSSCPPFLLTSWPRTGLNCRRRRVGAEVRRTGIGSKASWLRTRKRR